MDQHLSQTVLRDGSAVELRLVIPPAPEAPGTWVFISPNCNLLVVENAALEEMPDDEELSLPSQKRIESH
jgi:hypothetical protein